MPEDLDTLVKWADKWQMQFNVSKCKVMRVGKTNLRHLYLISLHEQQRTEISRRRKKRRLLEVIEMEKDLGVMITSNLKCSQQCEYAYSNANRVMGMIKRTISYKEPEIMLSLYKHRRRSWEVSGSISPVLNSGGIIHRTFQAKLREKNYATWPLLNYKHTRIQSNRVICK